MVKSIGVKKLRTAIFISGNGSNMKNLIRFSKTKNSPIVVDFVLSNNKKANGITHEKKNKIKAVLKFEIILKKLKQKSFHSLQLFIYKSLYLF